MILPQSFIPLDWTMPWIDHRFPSGFTVTQISHFQALENPTNTSKINK